MRQRRWKMSALLAALAVAGCAGAPPAGTPERAAWEKHKQELAAGIEREGRLGGSLDKFRPETR